MPHTRPRAPFSRAFAAGLRAIYAHLFAAYGPQHWWPADSRFEVVVGAVLTQNAAWSNVEKAIAQLRQRAWLTPEAVLANKEGLAEAIRPSGYFNVKAKRLIQVSQWYLDHDADAGLSDWEHAQIRASVLAIHGVGPETADDIVLYAFDRPVFVIDAYTRRLLRRYGLLKVDVDYETLRAACEAALGWDAPLFNEFHALIVRHAKVFCRVRPVCEACVLRADCRKIL
jgi:endonuclease III related protein